MITFGALQSNHARQTAAACATTGLTCDLILTRAVDRSDEHYLHSGNLLLDDLLGARSTSSTTPMLPSCCSPNCSSRPMPRAARSTGSVPAAPTPSARSATSPRPCELAEQARATGPPTGRIVVAASTAGTAAGLVLGAALAGLDVAVDVACVYDAGARPPATCCGAHRPHGRGVLAALAVVGRPGRSRTRRWATATAIPTAEAMAAIELLARTEGILLDPVYTAKAFAHLLARIDGYDGDVVFLHTGGSPGLFAYTSDVERPRPFSTP